MIHDNTVLKDEYKDQLFDYQVGRINQIFQEFCELNSSQNSYVIQSCPSAYRESGCYQGRIFQQRKTDVQVSVL